MNLRISMPTPVLNYGQLVNWQCPLNRGLLSWWLSLPQGGKGNTFFDIAGKNHGTLTNGPTWVANTRSGAIGPALDFDGSDDHVLVPNTTQLEPSTVTVCGWFRMRAWSGYDNLIGKSNSVWSRGFALVAHPESSGRIGFFINNYTSGGLAYIAQSSVSLDRWYFLCGTYDLANVRFYVDGIEAASSAFSTAINYTLTTDGFFIGRNHSSLSAPNCVAADFRIYNRALSASEVWQLYQDSLQGYRHTLNRIRMPLVNAAAAAATGWGPLLSSGRNRLVRAA